MTTRLAPPGRARTFSAVVIVVTVTTLFGLQLLRALITGTSMYLYEVLDLPRAVCGAALLSPVLLAVGIGRAVPRHDPHRALVVLASGVTAVRVAEQASASPSIDLALGAVGVALWVLFLSVAAAQVRSDEEERGFLAALLLAIALDTVVKGAFGTMDLAWVRTRTGFLVLGVAVVAQLGALTTYLRRTCTTAPALERAPVTMAPLATLGPVLVVELVLLQNIGRLSNDAGISWEWAFVAITTANVAAIAAILVLPLRGIGRASVVLAGAVLALASWANPTGSSAVAVRGVGVLAATTLLLAASRGGVRGPGGHPVVVGLGAALALVLAHDASYVFVVPYDRRLVLPAAALVATFAAARSYGSRPGTATRSARPTTRRHPVVAAALVLGLLGVPLAHALTQETAEVRSASGLPIRVMTFNLHNGFDPDGAPSIERLAAIIERESPDVVALQEVSRAWLSLGSFDMLEWLADRLDMPYVWGPSVDGVWGNAVLSRVEITDAVTIAMPNNDRIGLDRAFTRVAIDRGDGAPLQLFVTHLHAIRDDHTRRIEQLDVLLAEMARVGSRDVVLVGDLNFRPWDLEFDLLRAAGLVDAFTTHRRATATDDPGNTTRANVRIDYVWTTPSIRTRDFVVGTQFASDHLPVSVTIDPQAGQFPRTP